jgi:hypothetical protein
MAAGIAWSPGSEYGPCIDRCAHTDCSISWSEARAKCGICGVQVGFERRYYNDATYGKVHAVCLEDLVERERAERSREVPF